MTATIATLVFIYILLALHFYQNISFLSFTIRGICDRNRYRFAVHSISLSFTVQLHLHKIHRLLFHSHYFPPYILLIKGTRAMVVEYANYLSKVFFSDGFHISYARIRLNKGLMRDYSILNFRLHSTVFFKNS